MGLVTTTVALVIGEYGELERHLHHHTARSPRPAAAAIPGGNNGDAARAIFLQGPGGCAEPTLNLRSRDRQGAFGGRRRSRASRPMVRHDAVMGARPDHGPPLLRCRHDESSHHLHAPSAAAAWLRQSVTIFAVASGHREYAALILPRSTWRPRLTQLSFIVDGLTPYRQHQCGHCTFQIALTPQTIEYGYVDPRGDGCL